MFPVGKSIETESSLMVSKSGGGGRNGDWLLMGMGFLSGVMKMF